MNRIFTYISTGLAAIAMLSGCDNAKYDVIENGIYIEEAALEDSFTQQVETQIVDEAVTRTLTIRMARPTDVDVTVTLGMDIDFMNRYNERNSTSYQLLPEEYMSLDNTVTIPAGSISATSNLTIQSFRTPNGESYAIPVKIASVTGPVTPVSDAVHIMFLLQAPHRQKAPILDGSNAANASVTFASKVSPATWTIEYWLRMGNKNGYTEDPYVFCDNSAPISFGELLLRWWKIGALLLGPCYQNQMNGFYFDDNTEAWQEDTWYHIAYTYDGSIIQMYIDGQANASKQAPAGKTFDFDKVTLCQNWGTSYGQTTMLAQIRMWSTCLGQAAIKDAMNREVPADSDGLFGYWKCDEGEGNILHDSSPNGNDITLHAAPEWSDEINFLRPNE